MIDDLLNFDNQDFGEDDADARFAMLMRQSSASSSGIHPKQSTIADEEIKRIREKAEQEKEQSLKQFQQLINESMLEVNASQVGGGGW